MEGKIKETMEINVKIENLIRKPCHNFLSYLYNSDGWKRVMFDMAKENYITSSADPSKRIKIQIVNDGTIRLTGYSVVDILRATEYIQEKFDYARMPYLFFDEYVTITLNFKNSFTVNSSQYYVEPHLIEGEDGTILIDGNSVTITTSSYSSLSHLYEVAMKAFSSFSTSTSSSSAFSSFEKNVVSVSESVEENESYDSDTTIDTTSGESCDEGDEQIEGKEIDSFNMEGLCISAVLTWCAVKVIEAI